MTSTLVEYGIHMNWKEFVTITLQLRSVVTIISGSSELIYKIFFFNFHLFRDQFPTWKEQKSCRYCYAQLILHHRLHVRPSASFLTQWYTLQCWLCMCRWCLTHSRNAWSFLPRSKTRCSRSPRTLHVYHNLWRFHQTKIYEEYEKNFSF